jgi:hypothetical protein
VIGILGSNGHFFILLFYTFIINFFSFKFILISCAVLKLKFIIYFIFNFYVITAVSRKFSNIKLMLKFIKRNLVSVTMKIYKSWIKFENEAKNDLFSRHCLFNIFSHSFETGPVWRVDSGPGWPGAGTGPGWRKNRRRKNPVWPGQKPSCNPLTFVFLLKRRRFNFFKKLTRTIWWFGQNPKPGYENYAFSTFFALGVRQIFYRSL